MLPIADDPPGSELPYPRSELGERIGVYALTEIRRFRLPRSRRRQTAPLELVDKNDVRDDLLRVVLWTDARRLLFLIYGSEGVVAVQHIRRLYESFRVVSASMGQDLGFATISEARASACVSIYSLMCATLPSRTVKSKTHSSLYGLFVA